MSIIGDLVASKTACVAIIATALSAHSTIHYFENLMNLLKVDNGERTYSTLIWSDRRPCLISILSLTSEA
jgi:hypothetical protein